jgi:hypothetical protein
MVSSYNLHCSLTATNHSSGIIGIDSWSSCCSYCPYRSSMVVRYMDVDLYIVSPNLEFGPPVLRILEVR